MSGARPGSDGQMLPGISARSWMIGVYVMVAAILAVLIAGLATIFISRFTFDASDAPVAFYTIFFAFMVFILSGVVFFQLGKSRLQREMTHGYVTMPYDYTSFDLRDPRDGRVLRTRGEHGGSHPLSVRLSPWRAKARNSP